MWAKLGAKRLGTRRAGTRWKSERTPGKGEMYHWIKWPHRGWANVVQGRGGAMKVSRFPHVSGPVQNSGTWVRGAAGPWDERKQILQDERYDDIPKMGDAPRSYRTGGLPVPCDTPFKCKARLRDKQVSCCQVCPDELYLPADRYYGADEYIEKDPFRPITRDFPAPKTLKVAVPCEGSGDGAKGIRACTESEAQQVHLSGSDATGARTAECPAAIDDEFLLPCCKVCPGKSAETKKLKGLKIEKARKRLESKSTHPWPLFEPLYGNEFTGFQRYPQLTGDGLGKLDAPEESGGAITGGGVFLEEEGRAAGGRAKRRAAAIRKLEEAAVFHKARPTMSQMSSILLGVAARRRRGQGLRGRNHLREERSAAGDGRWEGEGEGQQGRYGRQAERGQQAQQAQQGQQGQQRRQRRRLMEHSNLQLRRDGAGGQRMKKNTGMLPQWKKDILNPPGTVMDPAKYYIDDFSNNYGQAEPADIDGKKRDRLDADGGVESTPTSAVCCGGGYACCRWCPTICDDLERSMEILPKLWWSVCHNFDEFQTAMAMTKTMHHSSGGTPQGDDPIT
jgi:hypothetical protein